MLQFREVGGGERFLPPPCRLVCRMCEETERVKERSKRGDRQLPLFSQEKGQYTFYHSLFFPCAAKK